MNYYNQKTKITASIMGILLGIAGFVNHGIFEVLQGNTPTNGFLIEAIGEAHRFWLYGGEGAFTLIPNFLITGICVMLVSLAIIFWSIWFIHKKHGIIIFLLLLILLTLVGGGVGHIVLFLPTWAFATRINKPLNWWGKILSIRTRKILAKMWKYALVITCLLWLIVLEIGIFGYFPGQSNPETILKICLTFLFSTVLFASLSFICGFARDIEERKLESNSN